MHVCENIYNNNKVKISCNNLQKNAENCSSLYCLSLPFYRQKGRFHAPAFLATHSHSPMAAAHLYSPQGQFPHSHSLLIMPLNVVLVKWSVAGGLAGGMRLYSAVWLSGRTAPSPRHCCQNHHRRLPLPLLTTTASSTFTTHCRCVGDET